MGSFRIAHAGLAFVFVSAAISIALLVLGAWQFVLGLVAVSLIPLIYFVGSREIEDRQGLLLTFGWICMLIAPGANYVSGVPLGYVLEIMVFGLALASLRGVLRLTDNDRVLKALIVLLAIHYLIAFLSSVLGRSMPYAAFWQLQYSLKWPIMFGLGTLIVWNHRFDSRIRFVIKWSWILLVIFLLMEILSPTVHAQLFGPNDDVATNPFVGVGRRYRSLFSHAGYFAIASALLSAGALAQALGGRSRAWLIVGCMYGALVLASGQRQELFALIVTVTLFLVIRWRRYLFLQLVALGLIGVVVLAALIHFEHIPMEATLAQWGLLDSLTPFSERAILTKNGLLVAQQYFPLGAGLGTYGGPGAQKHDLSLFLDLGFGQYWWFRRGLFVVDTYWPSIVAESGFFGAIALVALFTLMWFCQVWRAWSSIGQSILVGELLSLAALTLLLANTPSSPILTDPRGALIFWLLVGAAWRANHDRQAAQLRNGDSGGNSMTPANSDRSEHHRTAKLVP
jgi:hypothetical protein